MGRASSFLLTSFYSIIFSSHKDHKKQRAQIMCVKPLYKLEGGDGKAKDLYKNVRVCVPLSYMREPCARQHATFD
jgi:hypothetical protein